MWGPRTLNADDDDDDDSQQFLVEELFTPRNHSML